LPDDEVLEILDEKITQRFKNGEYYKGIREIILEIEKKL